MACNTAGAEKRRRPHYPETIVTGPTLRFWLTILVVIPVAVFRNVNRVSDAILGTVLMRRRVSRAPE